MKLLALTSLLLASASTFASNATYWGVDGRERTFAQVAAIEGDADTNRQCHQQNGGYIPTLKPGQYASSAFHNCFRTASQIYEYLDALVAQNPSVLTKLTVSSTTRGQTIYGYKLSTGNRGQSLYFQSMQHAREWIAGSSHLYTISSILDDLANNRPTPADTFDLYFVPIVNIDGYDIAWGSNRYQRKNANEVDLNRNWPSLPNPRPPPPSDETYPGPYPFSEAESKGIDAWLKGRRSELQGFIDIHSYAGLLLYPFGDTRNPIGNGYDAKFQTLGANLQRVMGAYKPQPTYQLYLAYGGFSDYAFREYKKASITIEVVGNDFVAPASSIRTRGKEIYNGIVQFAKEVLTFNGNTAPPTTRPPTSAPVTNPVTLPPRTTATPTVAPTTRPPVTPAPSSSGSCKGCTACYSELLAYCFPADYTQAQCNDFNAAGYQAIWCGN